MNADRTRLLWRIETALAPLTRVEAAARRIEDALTPPTRIEAVTGRTEAVGRTAGTRRSGVQSN
jgi:hypothetical protein